MESSIPISYRTPGIVIFCCIHRYWSYITISSYSILGYLHNFPQCLHLFYPLIHLGFYPLSFLLLLIMVSYNVQIIIHELDHKYLKTKTPMRICIYLTYLFVCYSLFISLDIYNIPLRPSILIYPTLPPHYFSTTRI